MKRRRPAVLIGGAAAAAAWLYFQVQPPAALHAPPPWPGLVDVTVVNPGRGRQAHQTILLRDARIETIRNSGASDPRDVRARTFAKRYVLPGLIDLHVRQLPPFMHLERLSGLMYLAGGVTTVRDVGNFDGELRATQAAIRDGTLVFPRLIACGRMLEGIPPRCPYSRTLRDAADAARAVDEVVAMGAQCVYTRSSVPDDLRAAVDAAAGSRQLAVAAESRTGAVHVALLAPWHLGALAEQYPAGSEPFQTFLPPPFGKMIWPAQVARVTEGRPHPGLLDGLFQAAIAANASRAAGVPLCLGTGAPGLYAAPGGSARIAIEDLVSLGLTREEAWVAATRVAGEQLGIAQLGSIEPGAPADLLVFREDPTQSGEAFASLEAVISQGRLYPSPLLIAQLLEYTRFFQRWVTTTRLSVQTRWRLTTDPAELVECQLP